jgi:hypothetical protein
LIEIIPDKMKKIRAHLPFAIVVLYSVDLILTGEPLKEAFLSQEQRNWIALSVIVSSYIAGYVSRIIQENKF